MAKNYRLIPGENNNWEVALFLLIDNLFIPNSQISRIEFTRSDMHSSTKALNFIENLLGPLGYVVHKTLSNSISSAITRLEQAGYVNCYEDGQCLLTNDGYKRLQEIKKRHLNNEKEPIGMNKLIVQAVKNLKPKPCDLAYKEGKDWASNEATLEDLAIVSCWIGSDREEPDWFDGLSVDVKKRTDAWSTVEELVMWSYMSDSILIKSDEDGFDYYWENHEAAQDFICGAREIWWEIENEALELLTSEKESGDLAVLKNCHIALK